MRIEKAIEITDAKIHFVSLVDKAANKRQFLITKAKDGQAEFATLGRILKVDNDTHYITGVVYEPLIEDSHGNFMTEDEIRKAAYWFAKNGDKVDLQHSFEAAHGVSVVETYIAPCNMDVGETTVLKGTWLMTAEVDNDEIWEKVQKGEVTGFSMGGVGKYSEADVELANTVKTAEKIGLFKKMATFFGLDAVVKGEVKDKYAEKSKINSFWNAMSALEEALYNYDWENNEACFEDDEIKIRTALSEFSEIIIELLEEDNIVKSLTAHKPITKAGKKISSRNYSELQKIYENIGALIETLSDADKNEENEEDEKVNKQEIQTMIDEAVKKAAELQKEPEVTPLTSEDVQTMIADAVQKTFNPTAEIVTAEMVAEMVSKAVEPIIKSRGLPSNLSDEKNIEKLETAHYLTGII